MRGFILFTLAVVSLPIQAEPPKPPKAEDFAGRLNLEVPQSAGFALLGVTPEKVIDPQGGHDLGAALLQGLDSDGNFQSGFALETRPYLWNQDEYIPEPSSKDRFLAGFKVSLATTTGLDDKDKANRYGIGVNWTYQFNDPLFNDDYLACVKELAEKFVPAIPPDDLEKQRPAIEANLRKGVVGCQKQYISWTTTALALGVAANRAKEKEMNLDESGSGLWITGSFAFSKRTELTGHARYVDNQLTVVDGTLSQTDSTVLATRFRYGGDSVRGVLEASWNDEETASRKNDYSLVSVGAEFKVLEGAWFRVAYGKTFGSSEKDQEFFTGQLRFGFGGEPLAKF